MLDAFDANALMERVDGDVEFLDETIAMLDEDSPALKGMLANFCAEPAEAAARELEAMGREGRLSDVGSAADRVRSETERLRKDLHEFLRSKTK